MQSLNVSRTVSRRKAMTLVAAGAVSIAAGGAVSAASDAAAVKESGRPVEEPTASVPFILSF